MSQHEWIGIIVIAVVTIGVAAKRSPRWAYIWMAIVVVGIVTYAATINK